LLQGDNLQKNEARDRYYRVMLPLILTTADAVIE
jgi:hypothetical protein